MYHVHLVNKIYTSVSVKCKGNVWYGEEDSGG